jgi:hypothetical protein
MMTAAMPTFLYKDFAIGIWCALSKSHPEGKGLNTNKNIVSLTPGPVFFIFVGTIAAEVAAFVNPRINFWKNSEPSGFGIELPWK